MDNRNTNKIGKSIYGKLVQDLSRLKDENQKVIICAISQIGFETQGIQISTGLYHFTN